MHEPPRLELECFGAPTARLDGRPAPPQVRWQKHLALLVYLALSPDRTRARSHLVGLLWPEKPERQARHALNQALSRLRRGLGRDRLICSKQAIALAEGGLAVDALVFDDLRARHPGDAVALVRGDFLEGFDLPDAPGFEEWAMRERARYRESAAAALVAAAEAALAAARYGEAAAAAQRALGFSPYAEPAARVAIQAAALAGDTAGAEAAYHAFGARLAADLGTAPSKALRALAEGARVATAPRVRRGAGTPDAPLVGREPVHRAVFAAVAAGVREGARAIVITGEPGTGKTRLLGECLERVRLEGGVVAVARPLESDQDAPWSTVAALVRAGLLEAPGSAAADPAARELLSHLPTAAADAARVGSALASLLAAVADERPVGIGVDDAHLSDGVSLEALGAALARLGEARAVAVVTAVRSWADVPESFLRLRAGVGRTLPGAAVELAPFSDQEIRSLVEQSTPWCAGDAERERLARRVYFETGGNPFLAVTLLRGLAAESALRRDALAWPPPGATDDSPLPISVPQLARRVIAARVGGLDEASRRVLQAASVGAAAVDVGLVAQLAAMPPAAVEDALAVLERGGFVRYDGARYALAPLVAQVVLVEWLLPGERRVLRERAMAALAPRSDIEARLLRAQLAASVAAGPPAFDAALDVARAALAAGLRRTARQALTAAARALPAADEQRRLALAQCTAAVSES
jgi:DNA-binding SARP family transcriptional activator